MLKKLTKNPKNAGHLIRIGSAGGMLANAFIWYTNVKDYVLGEVIDVLGSGLTKSIDELFGLYGGGELISAYGQFKEEKKAGIKPHFLKYSGRVARMAPITSPIISQLTDGDFLSSVLIPAGVCVLGWGSEYMGKTPREDE